MAHFYQNIGNRIKGARKKRGYTRRHLAAAINMEEDKFKALEEGRIRIFTDQIARLADVLKVTTDYLIYGNK